jgi:hypothetical protein
MSSRRVPADQARAELYKMLSEAELLEQVRAAARALGWLSYHTWRSDRSEAGFPDLCLVRAPRLIFAETKRENGRVSDAQRGWLDQLAACTSVEAVVWRPSDSARIVETLRQLDATRPESSTTKGEHR